MFFWESEVSTVLCIHYFTRALAYWRRFFAVGMLLLTLPAAVAQAQTVIEFSNGIPAGAQLGHIAAGPDGNMWFTQNNPDAIGRITPGGVVTYFSNGISAGAGVFGITTGPDGNLWFTEYTGNRIGRITPAGVVTEFDAKLRGPISITAGPDGNLWYGSSGSAIGRITTQGVATAFSTGAGEFYGIAAGPDGNFWFTDHTGNRIGRITPTGAITWYSAGLSANTGPLGIAAGTDGNLWFTEYTGNRIGRITPTGVITEFSAGMSPGVSPREIAAGPGGDMWFTEYDGNHLGRITTSGVISEFSQGISQGAKQLGMAVDRGGRPWSTQWSGGRIAVLDIAMTGLVPLSVNGSGAGVVRSDQGGISCGTTCSASFASGANVTLTATPNNGNTFTGWSGACSGSGSCTVTMNTAKSVTATFKTIPFTAATTGVTAGVIPAGVATVTNKITFNSADVGKTGSVFITAVVPSSFLASLPLAAGAVRAMSAAPFAGTSTSSSTLVLVQLTSSGWKPVVNGQLIPYATGVLGDQLAAQTILSSTNTSLLSGAQFCAGYGTNAAEMSEASRMLVIATVADPSTTSASRQSCLVTDTLQVLTGWNLLGNSRNQSAQVDSLYSDSSWVTSVWKWDAVQKRWQFYSPSMDAAALLSLINDKGYGALGEIKAGEGYWVQATAPASVTIAQGTAFDLTSASLVAGWNLVTSGSSQTPSVMTSKLGGIQSLWAWDGSSSKWYFYTPRLDTGTALIDYIKDQSYLDWLTTIILAG